MDYANEIINRMLSVINDIAESSQDIFKDAKNLLEEARKKISGPEAIESLI